MSKTAVIISAHMRSFERCFPTIAWHVLRHYQNCDFFVSTVRDRDIASVNLIEQRFPDSRVVIEVCDAQPELPIPVQPHDPKWLPMTGQMFSHEPYAISVHPQAVLRQLWHLQRAWEFFCVNRPELGVKLTSFEEWNEQHNTDKADPLEWFAQNPDVLNRFYQ